MTPPVANQKSSPAGPITHTSRADSEAEPAAPTTAPGDTTAPTAGDRFGAATPGRLSAALPPPVDTVPTPPRRRRRAVAFVLLAIVVLAAAALAGRASAGRGTTLVWQTRSALSPGQSLAGRLRPVRVESRAAVGVVPASTKLDQLTARTALPAGALLTPQLVSSTCPNVPAGYALTGVAAPAGTAPAEGLLPGDVVSVIAVPPAPGNSGPTLPARTVLAAVTVWANGPPQANTTTLTLLIPAAQVDRVAGLSARGQLSLVRHGHSPVLCPPS